MELIDIGKYGLKGKSVIVTGGGAGIGRGVAVEMSKVGAYLTIVELDEGRAEDTTNEIRAMGGKALKVVADCTKNDLIEKTIERTFQEFGTIDILVNNAGGILGTKGGIPFLEMTEEFWDNIMNINMKSTFLWTKVFASLIIRQNRHGSIVNISSIADRVPWMPVVIYGAAKAGVSNFTQNMAVELGRYNIRVNAICPGRIQTMLSEQLWHDMPEARQLQLKSIPLGRFGTPEDVGRVAVFLASDAASYVSGATILVSGGLTQLLF